MNDISRTRKAIIMAMMDAAGVGPKTFQQLLMNIGPPENCLSATYDELESIPRIKEKGARLLLDAFDSLDEYNDRIDGFLHKGISMLSFFDDDYPQILRQIDDPPPAIFIKGDIRSLNLNLIALVGTTQASQPGLRMAVDISKQFVARGFGIISGLALGIDSAAHLAALKADGVTIAVLGSGILNIYPKDNIVLAENISQRGLLISEQSPFRNVRAAALILRNRLISALSKAVVVVQVGEKRRGELRTVQYSYKQARPAFFADPENDLDREIMGPFGQVISGNADSVDEIISYIV